MAAKTAVEPVHEPDQVFTPARQAEAEQRAERITACLVGAAEDIAQAIAEQDWLAMGLSRDQWRQRVFGDKRLTVQARKQVHALLSGTGMSPRKIGQATGTPHRTVRDDLDVDSPSEGCAETAHPVKQTPASELPEPQAVSLEATSAPVDAQPSDDGQAVSLGADAQTDTPGVTPWPVPQAPLPPPCARCAEKDGRISELERACRDLALELDGERATREQRVRLGVKAALLDGQPRGLDDFDPMNIA
jgi:hypothetical protein